MSLFLRKLATDSDEAAHAATGLKRSLTALDVTLLGIGAIIGAGIFSSIKDMIVGTSVMGGQVTMLGAGPAVMISFLLTAIACGFAALCYAEIAAMVPVSGSAYSYTYAAFGELLAWIIGWDLIIEYAIGNVYVADKWAVYFQTFLHGMFGVTLPVWALHDLQTAHAMAQLPEYAGAFPTIGSFVLSINLPATAITLLLSYLLFLGIKESARANAIMVYLKVGLVIAFIAMGFWAILTKGEHHWTPFAPNGFKGVWQGAALGFFSYIGFDAVSTAGEECKNPQRDLPRGLIYSLLICTVLYVLVAAALTGVVPMEKIVSDDPLSAALEYLGFSNVATLFAFGAVIAMTAVLLVFQLGQTRIFMVMSRDGLLPKVFSKVHSKHRTPHVATWVTGGIVALSTSVLTSDQAILLTNVGTLFAFILVSLGVIVLRVRDPDRPRPFRVPLYPLTPILSVLACLGLVLGLERTSVWRLLVWLAIGLVVYFAYGYRNSVLRRSMRG